MYIKLDFFRNKFWNNVSSQVSGFIILCGCRYSAGEDEDQREYDISDHDDGLEEDSATVEEQNQKKKTLVAPYKKRKIVLLQQQGLSQLAASVSDLATVQKKKHTLSLESDLKREEIVSEI